MSTLYAIADCARDDRIFDLVHDALFPMCLFRTDVLSPLGRASPYLLPVEHADALMAAWRRDGVGQSWGMLLTSSLEQAKLLQRLRTFNEAKLPDGRVVLFRWWDPRVFRAYLSTCDKQEINALFENVDSFVVEDEEGSRFTAYSNQGGTLVARQMDHRSVFEVTG